MKKILILLLFISVNCFSQVDKTISQETHLLPASYSGNEYFRIAKTGNNWKVNFLDLSQYLQTTLPFSSYLLLSDTAAMLSAHDAAQPSGSITIPSDRVFLGTGSPGATSTDDFRYSISDGTCAIVGVGNSGVYVANLDDCFSNTRASLLSLQVPFLWTDYTNGILTLGYPNGHIDMAATGVSFSELAGSGARMVVADASGKLGSQTIPSGTVTSVATGTGLLGGTITSTGTLKTDTTSQTGHRTIRYEDSLYSKIDTIPVLTIAQALAKDVANSWKEGKWYMVKDNTGSFSGANALHTYIAMATDTGTGVVRLSTTGFGYVRVFSGLKYNVTCDIGYSVSEDKWFYCYDPKLQVKANSGTLGNHLNEINWGVFANCIIDDVDFVDGTSSNFVNDGQIIRRSTIDWNSTTNTFIQDGDLDNATVNFHVNGEGLDVVLALHGATIEVYSRIYSTTIGEWAFVRSSRANNSIDGCTVGNYSTLDLGIYTGNIFFQQKVGDYMVVDSAISNYNPAAPMTYDILGSTYTITVDVDTAVVLGTLSLPAWVGNVILLSGTATPTTITNIVDYSGNPITDHAITFTAQVGATFSDGDVWFDFPTPASSTVLVNNDKDFLTLKWSANTSLYLQTSSVLY